MRAVAILARTQAVAAHWVRQAEQRGELRSFSRPEMRGAAVFLGVERPFLVATSPEQLRGAELVGFETVGPVDPDGPLARAALVRVRS